MSRVVGHDDVITRFSTALKRGRLHHAWLLHGISGVGKHTVAEHMAAMFLCEQQRACGECHGCLMKQAGSHPDIHRVALEEKKRDISITQVRELLAFLSLSGAESERRVVILDDAERLNNQAANALLKGLEEPGAGSLLLIVCDDILRLPATIRSRCMLEHCAPLDEEGVRAVFASAMPELAAKSELCTLAVEMADGAPGTVAALQDAKIAAALLEWRQLVGDIATADIGALESWTRQHVASVPHGLIVRALLLPLQQQKDIYREFSAGELVLQAINGCLKWPGEVVRHTLRAAPSLLAVVLALRSALRAADKVAA